MRKEEGCSRRAEKEGERKRSMFPTYLPNANVRAVIYARQRYSQFIFYFDNKMFYIFSKKFKLHVMRIGVEK